MVSVVACFTKSVDYWLMWLAMSHLLLAVGLIWNILVTSTELQSGRRHWTRAENEELMVCYCAGKPSIYGFCKWLDYLWYKWNSSNTIYLSFNEQRLCGQVCSLLQHQYFTDPELSRLESQAMENPGSDTSGNLKSADELTVHHKVDDSIGDEIVTNSFTHQQIIVLKYQC